MTSEKETGTQEKRGTSTGGKIAIVLGILFILGLGYLFFSRSLLGPTGLIAQTLPRPSLSIVGVSYSTQGNILSGYYVPLSFIVQNNGDGEATGVRATVTLYDSKGTLRGNQDVSLGSVPQSGSASGNVRFDVGRLETITGTTFSVIIQVGSNEGVSARYG